MVFADALYALIESYQTASFEVKGNWALLGGMLLVGLLIYWGVGAWF